MNNKTTHKYPKILLLASASGKLGLELQGTLQSLGDVRALVENILILQTQNLLWKIYKQDKRVSFFKIKKILPLSDKEYLINAVRPNYSVLNYDY
ncbi:hypothetical protein OAS07_02535 [Candidatus Thioglobus sp.]|nr:hypothetical protein [Candidatus Thioglobus sp.]MDC1165332.1 hypothetical protein [Candidatus Thioglobus sp.]